MWPTLLLLVTAFTATIPRLNGYRGHLDYIGIDMARGGNFPVPIFEFKFEPLNCLSSYGLQAEHRFYNQSSRDTYNRCWTWVCGLSPWVCVGNRTFHHVSSNMSFMFSEPMHYLWIPPQSIRTFKVIRRNHKFNTSFQLPNVHTVSMGFRLAGRWNQGPMITCLNTQIQTWSQVNPCAFCVWKQGTSIMFPHNRIRMFCALEVRCYDHISS